MKKKKLTQDHEGIMTVLTPNWNIDPEHPKAAPTLTIYSDLILTGDPRNANIAKPVYDFLPVQSAVI